MTAACPAYGDFSCMIMLGVRGRQLPSTRTNVIAALQGRGLVTVVPEIFRSGHRGPSSHILANDGSELQAWIPAFGPDPWASCPEALVAQLLEHGVEAVIAPCAPAQLVAEHGPYDGAPVEDYRPKASPPRARPTPTASAQLGLFA